MKLISKIYRKLAAVVLAMMMAATPQMTMAQTAQIQQQQNVRLQDDFYEAVNKEWLANTTLKPGYSEMDTFAELNDKCQDQIQELFSNILKNESQYSNGSPEKNMINYYKNYLNKTERNKQGMEPVKPYLEKISSIQSLKDIDSFLSDVVQSNMVSLYSLGVQADLKDSSKRAFYVYPTGLLGSNSDYYNNPNEQGKKIISVNTRYIKSMLAMTGYSQEEAAKKTDQAFAFEKKLTPYIMGQEAISKDTNIYDKRYNVYTLDQLDGITPNMKLGNKIRSYSKGKVTKVIVTEPEAIKALDKLYVEQNVAELKNYIEVKFLCSSVGTLSEDFEKNAEEFSAELTGQKGSLSDEKKALNRINSVFSDEIGKLYVENYFSEAEKKDVENLVHQIIAEYKKKIAAVDWMTDETKKNAIKKLDAMTIKIGYPDKWEKPESAVLKSYEEGSSFFENNMELIRKGIDKMLEELDQPVDKQTFEMPPQTINAQYSPVNNDITFPAGILQAPFYDIKRSREANLGSIGAVIAHEISHAFDTTGANFDEKGNLKQWWTKEDYDKFQKKADAVKNFYNNVTTDSGQKVNGTLTVGENISDITGMSCMLDIMKEMKDPDYKAFFESWAVTWRMVATDETKAMLLQADVHSPNKVRANAVVEQFQEFYDTYGVKEGDKMYVKPEDRVKVY